MTSFSHQDKFGNLLATALLLILFVVCARFPLAHTDLWGHLAYGRYLAEVGHFPATEPFLKLSDDQPLVTTSWLSQWIGYQIQRTAGPIGLQFLNALLCTALFTSIYCLTVRLTREPWIGIVSLLIFGALEYQQLVVFRPQLTGMLCFCLLLCVLNGVEQAVLDRNDKTDPGVKITALWKSRLLVGALSLLWANLHGSFAIGPVTIGMIGFGWFLDSFRDAEMEDRIPLRIVVRETAILLAISLIAGLINPYGIDLYREVVTFSASPNLYRFIEWKPLWFTPRQGSWFAAALLLALCFIVFSQQRFRWRDWLPVIVLAAMTLKTSRYIVWFTPLYVIALAPYLKTLLDRLASRSEPLRKLIAFSHREVSRSHPLTILLFVVAVLACSISRPSPYGSRTPIDVTEKLFELPPQTLILNTMEWGDWMIWRSRASLPIFVNSHATFIPPEIWEDYIRLSNLEPGWESALEKYPFSAAVLQKGRQRRLIAKLEADPSWVRIYRDEIAVIFVRASQD